MTDDYERHAGKAPEDRHPVQSGTEPDPSDYADPRVAQPGEDPPGERAMQPIEDDPPSA
ncbi:MAG TPA: hypothetical protein VFM03_01845 [Candidatus Limnocylindria bacterium]|jgi:hypothetical protein|nr:hypothetical protein [Candidatus Limnocylindria bacterium]